MFAVGAADPWSKEEDWPLAAVPLASLTSPLHATFYESTERAAVVTGRARAAVQAQSGGELRNTARGGYDYSIRQVTMVISGGDRRQR